MVVQNKIDNNISDFLKRQKYSSACGVDSKPYTQANYNKFYLKHALIELMKYNKPVIVTGYIELNPYDDYYSFKNIKPFYPEYENIMLQLCGHVNILKSSVDKYIDLYDSKNYTNELFVLICQPYVYKNKDGESRGGLSLTDALKIKPILFYEEALEKLKSVNKNKYVDFYHHRNGYFLGISSIEVDIQRQKQKKHEKYLRRQEIKKEKINLPFLNQKVFSLKPIEKKSIYLDYLFIEV